MTPYAPPSPSGDETGNRLPGIAAKVGAIIVSLACVLLVLQGILRALPGLRNEEFSESPIGILIGNGFWLLVLGALVAYLWRLGDHLLYPETQGFHVNERLDALSILERHGLSLVCDASVVDEMYASLSLRDLLRTYNAINKQQNPERLNSLLHAMRSHPDLQQITVQAASATR